MLTAKRLIAFLWIVLVVTLTTYGQEPPPSNAKIAAGAQDVLIIIQQQQVRFTASQPVEQMHLQVTNQAGEVVFDSGGASVLEIFWPLHDANNAPLKNGLYAYTLTVKTAQDKETRVRRGHFIVDRAQDRDGADKLWITSRDDGGVGTELTVSKHEGSTVAGTRTASKNKATGEVAAEIADGEAVKSLNGLTDHVKLAGGQNVTVGVEGDTITINAQLLEGQVVKGVNGLTDQITLEAGPNITITPDGNKLTIAAAGASNSSITELNGNIGIGTNSPTSKLTVQTPTASYGFSHTDGQVNLTSWVGTGTSGASGGWFGTKSNHALHFFTNDSGSRMTITPIGHVGIGTPNPASELHVHGLNPFITLSTAAGQRAYIQNAGGALVFKPSGFGDCCGALAINQNNGFAEFRGLSGHHEVQITSANDRAYLKLNSLLNGQRGTWSVESGIYGKPGWFGIYDWEARRGRLAIDPNGLVYVDALRITGGADFAEHFDVSTPATNSATAASSLIAGMVVSIDPNQPGKLQITTQAYDRRVAGIISGAGGVSPGMMMSQTGTLADGQHPVALSGRVYCYADTTQGAIEPGDLLTTSPTPGHAMKATNSARAQGAIIGKAMTGLQKGKGLVLVLVTLQ